MCGSQLVCVREPACTNMDRRSNFVSWCVGVCVWVGVFLSGLHSEEKDEEDMVWTIDV